MIQISTCFLRWIFMLPLLVTAVNAHEILVNTHDGEVFIFDIDPDETIHAIEEKVVALVDGRDSSLLIEVPSDGLIASIGAEARSQGKLLDKPRPYDMEVSLAEKADVHYIVTTLANKSLIFLAFNRKELEVAGNRIDHLHPLRFLMTVFTDEELKVGIRNIRGKGWVWNSFIGGLRECLTSEAGIGNVREEYIVHFAHTVGIDENMVLPAVRQGDWDTFIDLLITHIPRKGNHDRYDT